MLCHGTTHSLHPESCVLPLTPKAIRSMTFLDKDPSCKPDILYDWKKTVPERMHGKYDVITSICSDADLFIDHDNMGFVEQSFKNVIACLKPGGYFVMEPLSIASIKSVASFWKDAAVSIEVDFDVAAMQDVAGSPYNIEFYPKIEVFLNEFMSSSVEKTYDGLVWLKDTHEFYEWLSAQLGVKGVQKKTASVFRKL